MNRTIQISACKCNCLIIETRVCSHTISLSPKLKLCVSIWFLYTLYMDELHSVITASVYNT